MTGKWIRVNKTPVLDLRYRVSGLCEGNSYEFRVFAENVAGISEPSPTSDPIKAARAITRPGPPGSLKLKDWSKAYADICWTKPTRDGGSPILGYAVEVQKSGSAEWKRINKDLIKICAFRVPGLIEGMEYRVRVRANNAVGDSEPRELQETILAKDILVPPELTVDASCRDSLTVRAGQIINLITRVKGRPDPEITWTKDARALARDKRTDFLNNYPLCELVINDAVRSDYGKYAILAKNSSGQASATVIVNVLDTPGPCQNLKVAYATKNNSIPIEALIKGKPAPDLKWTKDERPEEIRRGLRHQLESGTDFSKLFITAARRTDSGAYTMTATNSAGSTLEATEVVERAAEPEFELDVELRKTLVVRAGCSIRMFVPIKGRPSPTVTWTKEGKAVTRAVIDSTESFTMLIIPESSRNDAGKYELTLENASGKKTAEVVIARNAAGAVSVPSDPSDPITCRDDIVEPRIMVDAVFKDVVQLKAGESFKLDADIAGQPTPSMVWTKNGKEVENTMKLEVRFTELTTILTNKDSVRADGGEFVLTATNVGGFAKHIFKVKVLDRPGPPVGPLKVSEVTADNCVIAWAPPADDGGAKIEGYVIEKRESSRLVWTNVASELQVTQFKVTKLLKGNEYIFRVMAVNKYGVGESLDSAPTIADNPYTVPDAPENPEVTAITKDSMSSITVAWNKPMYDGGSNITGYIVETCVPREKEEDEEWTIVTPKDGLTATSFTIINLKENQEYKVQISALNSEGLGEAAAVPENPKAEDRLLPPEMDLDVELRKVVSLRACCSLRLFVPIRGRPTPTAKWTKEDGEPVERATIDSTTSFTSLVIGNVNRFDSGKYNLTVENSSGSKTVTIQVRVLDTPSAPQNLKIAAVTCKSVTLTWEPPVNDGGVKVKNYIVEKRESTRKAYATVTTTCHGTSFTVDHLLESCNYYFRVLAENEYGIGLPIETGESVKVSEKPQPPGKVSLKDVTKSSVTLTWEKPEHDGGSRIGCYVVEVQHKGDENKVSEGVVARDPCDPRVLPRPPRSPRTPSPSPGPNPSMTAALKSPATSWRRRSCLKDAGSKPTSPTSSRQSTWPRDWCPITSTSSG
uniref:Titin n=1 Tax=Neogobius melanostomus TaxID=47308 RepID=A0A8C6V4Z3_9GOBI